MQLDTRALSDPVDRRAVRAFMQQLRSRFPQAGRRGSTDAAHIIVAILMLIVSVPLLVFGIAALALVDGLTVLGLTFSLVSAALVTSAVLLLVKGGSTGTTQYRLDRFAAANSMRFHPGYDDPQLPGMLFGVGRQRHSKMLVRGDAPRFVEFGNYEYTTGSGKSRTTHNWGYIAVRLDAPLPNIVLDATGNNGLFGSNLPVRLDKGQRLRLEGDFNEHFGLYCPQGYEADALYLFTPDIMRRFINRAAQLDVEIVDDWLLFYSRSPMSTLDSERWAWQFSVVGAMLDKIARWSRWRDERLGAASASPVGDVHSSLENPQQLRPPEGVAESGRRLKRRGVTWIVIVVDALALLQILRVLLDAIS